MKRKKRLSRPILLISLCLIIPTLAEAQTVPDPAVQEAKEETAVVYDLSLIHISEPTRPY